MAPPPPFLGEGPWSEQDVQYNDGDYRVALHMRPSSTKSNAQRFLGDDLYGCHNGHLVHQGLQSHAHASIQGHLLHPHLHPSKTHLLDTVFGNPCAAFDCFTTCSIGRVLAESWQSSTTSTSAQPRCTLPLQDICQKTVAVCAIRHKKDCDCLKSVGCVGSKILNQDVRTSQAA